MIKLIYLLTIAGFLFSVRSHAADYLSADLRVQVEQLKKEATASPTNRENGISRARVVWEWANAYAMNGGTLPVELPSLISRVMGRGATGRGNLLLLDQSIRELRIHDERPNAIGKVTTDQKGPLAPGAYVTIRQTYHFGTMSMARGGGFLVARHFMSNQGLYQTSNPEGDNYVTIKSSNPTARLAPNTRSLQGMHGGFRRGAPGLFFELKEGELKQGDTVTITYGDRSGGSRGFKVQTYSNDAFPLPLYVNLKGNRDLYTLPMQTYRVGGGPVFGVCGFAPSIVTPGEKFEISVRSEDFFYNRASGSIPEYSLSLNGEPFRKIATGKDAISLIRKVSFEEPGIYRLKIESADGKVAGECNPIWVRENPRLRVFWGETHGHCGFAEGQGTPDAYFRFGRDDARLDFLTLSEHDLWMDDSEWKRLTDKVDEYNRDGEFVAIAGYEWTVGTASGGHHNVFFRDTKNRRRVPNQTAPVLSQLYRRLANENDMDDVLIIPHAHQPGEYRMNERHMETLVEIMSMHGHFEWFGKMYLKHGHEVGFVAASDDHLSHPGYSTPLPGGLAARGGLAAVWSAEKTRDSIFTSMKRLSAYATTGQRIIMDLRMNGARMGIRTDFRTKRNLRGKIVGTAPLAEISVVKNGENVWSQDLLVAKSRSKDRSDRFEISFHSSTDPEIRDSPRGWRPWRGTLTVNGAELNSVSSPALQNRLSESVNRTGDQQAEFGLITRGGWKNLVIDLSDIGDDATVTLDLRAANERPSTPAAFRKPARLARQQIQFALSDLKEGIATHRQRIDQFFDTVTIRRIRNDVPPEYDLEYRDEKDPRRGDYYYVRVRQLDGGIAWSSPNWVGGFTKPRELDLK
jgi:hypothetical protein